MWPANMHKFKLLTLFGDWRIVVAGLEVTLATMSDATCDPYYAHLQSANPNPPCMFAAVLYAITHALSQARSLKESVRARTPLCSAAKSELQTPGDFAGSLAIPAACTLQPTPPGPGFGL